MTYQEAVELQKFEVWNFQILPPKYDNLNPEDDKLKEFIKDHREIQKIVSDFMKKYSEMYNKTIDKQ